MQLPDRTGVVLGYRVWRVIPGKWVPPSESLYAQTCHRSWSLTGATVAYCPPRVQGDPGKPLVRSSACEDAPSLDRKSTRLNSSHANISYAVFCLKQKHRPLDHPFSRY